MEDLENLLHECMLFSFNTEIEDGSIEEVMYYIHPLNFEPNFEPRLKNMFWYLDHIAIAVNTF